MKNITNQTVNKFGKIMTHWDDDTWNAEWPGGTRFWYKDLLRHREDGPAVEYPGGYKEWWFNGEEINCSSQEEFLRIMKLKVFW